MTGRALRVAVGAVLLALTCTGCGSGGAKPPTSVPSAAPSPSATYTCTPPGGTPTPCSPEQYTQEQGQAQLAEEAQRVYRRLVSELAALQRAGGASTPSPELAAVAGGPYLAAQQATLTRLAQYQAKVTGEVRIATLAAATGAQAKGFETALLACVDSTKATVVQEGKPLTKGQLVAEVVYFRREGTALKAWDAEKADPKRC
nr:hypothetical protein [Propionibacterium sp.]